ncbi:MAG TPA: hypothetical protein VJZ71_07830, partial [Phycisphaerae bacterium]|nr:hypothetical protein [Phycisphaerae bacterium]
MKRLFAMLSALGCAVALVGAFGGLTCDVPPGGVEIPDNAGLVKLQVNNLSGLPVAVEETYVLVDDQVRHTQRFLPPAGPASSAVGIVTLADTIIVRAQVANESDLNSLAVVGDLLAARVFRFGEDFQNGDTLVFDIPPPFEPAPNIIDCNRNGINDAVDIAGGESDDCDSNTVPDECQADTDHDGFINPCDGCPNDVNKQEPGICGCGKPDTGDADEDGILNCVDTCTDTDDDGFGNPGFPANTCPQDGCVDDPLKSAPGVCGCGVPDVGDADEDGVLDCVDPCPEDFFDDSDNDGSCDSADACPHDPDNDADSDGVCGDVDACPGTPSEEDADSNGCSCSQLDADSDGVDNCEDECPETPLDEEADADGCSCSQRDPDNDGVDDCNDDCADTPAKESVNAQGCGCSQVNCNDGDACTLDTCEAGICSNVFQDADSDEVCDANDQCPNTPPNEEPDANGCSCSQRDPDSDGVDDCDDQCASTPAGQPVNAQGCACSQVNCNDSNPCTLDTCAAGICSNVFQDADSDGVCDANDECPDTPLGEEVDSDGCSCSQFDFDNDGVDECDDACADTPAGQPVNAQGCACSQVNCDDGNPCTLDTCAAGTCSNVFQDADSDGVCNVNDECPGTPPGEEPDADGCSCSQRDPDGDGVDDCDDVCADTPAEQPVNAEGCACSQVNCNDGDPCTLDTCAAGICSN